VPREGVVVVVGVAVKHHNMTYAAAAAAAAVVVVVVALLLVKGAPEFGEGKKMAGSAVEPRGTVGACRSERAAV
jgi:hypothetical protein